MSDASDIACEVTTDTVQSGVINDDARSTDEDLIEFAPATHHNEQPMQTASTDEGTHNSENEDAIIVHRNLKDQPISAFFSPVPRRGRPSGSKRQSSRAGRPSSASPSADATTASDAAAKRLSEQACHVKPKKKRFVIPRDTYTNRDRRST